LQHIDSGFQKPEGYDKMTKEEILELITNGHIESIIKKQASHFKNIKSVDGKAGKSFLKIINGEQEKIADIKVRATADLERIEELFDSFDDNTALTNSHKNYIQNDIITQTIAERGAFDTISNTLANEAVEINQNVAKWSILCQVIFGPEKFYEFMMQVSNKSLETGQRRWYYTLIDLASFSATNTTATQETESGPIKIEE